MQTNEEANACECVRVRMGPGGRAVRVWVCGRGMCTRMQMLVHANALV